MMAEKAARFIAIGFLWLFLAISPGLSIDDSDYWENGGGSDNSGWDNGGGSDNSGWDNGGGSDNSGWDNGGGSDNSGWDNGGGSDNSGNTESGEGLFYSNSISESSGAVIDESSSNAYNPAVMAFIPGGNQNVFWIVSRDGSKNSRSIELPLYRYVRTLIIPATSGELILEERYPNGQVRSYDFGHVTAHRNYRIWFYADSRGTHLGRYRISNGPYSDTLTYNVR